MGTRNLTCVKVDGEYKVAQYCQWDGYPEGQGADILDILHNCDIDELKEKCRHTQWISEEEHDNLLKEECGNEDGWMTMEQSFKFEKKYPQLHRNTGAQVLKIILENEPGVKLVNSIKFAEDTLFCEWTYVIDFDEGKLHVCRNRLNPVKSFDIYNLPTERDFIGAFGKSGE